MMRKLLLSLVVVAGAAAFGQADAAPLRAGPVVFEGAQVQTVQYYGRGREYRRYYHRRFRHHGYYRR